MELVCPIFFLQRFFKFVVPFTVPVTLNLHVDYLKGDV